MFSGIFILSSRGDSIAFKDCNFKLKKNCFFFQIKLMKDYSLDRSDVPLSQFEIIEQFLQKLTSISQTSFEVSTPLSNFTFDNYLAPPFLVLFQKLFFID